MNLLSLVYNYIYKRNIQSSLNCGIFAWSGTSSDKFSPILFNIIGVFNDARGGDSSGVYFNRGSIKGSKGDARYEDLVKSHKLHTTIKPGRWPVVIGHCRKASVGAVNEGNIQPTLFRTNDKNDKLVYVQAHNGTISNYRELATKYKVAIEKDESDSLILGKLIYKCGFDVLAEYEGSAALLMHFIKEPNVLYAFHGQSKSYTTLAEERPLHYINVKGSGIYISSEARPLEWISNGEKPTSFDHNVLYKIEGDVVTEVKKIERAIAVFKKYTPVENSLPFHENENYYRGQSTHLSKIGAMKNICCCTIDFCLTNINADAKIMYSKGLFVHDKNYAHGEKLVDTWGYIRDPKLRSSSTMTIYHLYFYYGILLDSKMGFDETDKLAKSLYLDNAKDFYFPYNYNRMSQTLAKHSVFPFTRLFLSNPGSGYMEPTGYFPNEGYFHNDTFFTGKFIPLFTDIELHFEEGDFVGYNKYQGLQTIADLIKSQPFLNEWGFGVKEEFPLALTPPVKSCEECLEKDLYNGGERCMSCNLSLGEQDKVSTEDKKDEDESKATLCHTIAIQLNPILGDLLDLIEEIEVTGQKELVAEEFELLTEANDKLNSIIK